MPGDKNALAGAYPAAKRDPLADCPLNATFRAVGGRWKLTLLYWLAREPNHFLGVQRRVAPISHKVLTEQLRELEAAGLVERESTGPVPSPVRYRLSAYGQTVLPLVEAARVWGLEHLRRTRGGTATSDPSDALACTAAV